MLFKIFFYLLAVQSGFHEPWGKDADLKPPPPKKHQENPSIATQIADAVIRFHQEVIFPRRRQALQIRPRQNK